MAPPQADPSDQIKKFLPTALAGCNMPAQLAPTGAITKCELANFWAFASLIIELHRKTKRKLCKLKIKTRAQPKEAGGKDRQKTEKWIFYTLLAAAVVATCCSISLQSANLDVALTKALGKIL